jgi:hypothetical protein
VWGDGAMGLWIWGDGRIACSWNERHVHLGGGYYDGSDTCLMPLLSRLLALDFIGDPCSQMSRD